MSIDSLLDPERLAAVRATGLVDTPPEAEFDRLTRFAARLLDTPISLLTLVEETRQFFKSAVGVAVRETHIDSSLCRFVAVRASPLVLADAATDPQFAMHRAHTELGIRSYLGFPVRSQRGQVVGSFCVADHKPRQWSADELELLRDLTAEAEAEVRRREQFETVCAERDRLAGALQAADTCARAFRALPDPCLITRLADGRILEVSPGFTEVFGYRSDEAVGRTTVQLGLWLSAQQRSETLSRCDATGRLRVAELPLRHRDGHILACELAGSRFEACNESFLAVVVRETTAPQSPAPDFAPTSTRQPSTLAVSGTGERVMLIDDEEIVGQIAARVLKRIGYEPVVFSDPRAALTSFAAAPGSFDLVITDYTMPGCTGDEVVRRLLALRPDLPIIICSGHAAGLDSEKARELGARLLIEKPVSIEDLTAAVAACLTQRP